jgi:hypothetical protein
MPDWFPVVFGVVRIRLKAILVPHIEPRLACFNTLVQKLLRCCLGHRWAYQTPSAKAPVLSVIVESYFIGIGVRVVL